MDDVSVLLTITRKADFYERSCEKLRDLQLIFEFLFKKIGDALNCSRPLMSSSSRSTSINFDHLRKFWQCFTST